MTWLWYSLLSALFAAFTSILAKIGIASVDSNLATAIRTIVIVIFAWGIVFFKERINKYLQFLNFLLGFLYSQVLLLDCRGFLLSRITTWEGIASGTD